MANKTIEPQKPESFTKKLYKLKEELKHHKIDLLTYTAEVTILCEKYGIDRKSI